MDSRRTGFLFRYGGAFLSFFVPVALFLALSLRDSVLVNLGSDAKCYLSVADNFLQTGHFIQTIRASKGFVVPFGLPLILTVFRAIDMSLESIVVFQHIQLGCSCLLLYLAEKNRFGHGGFAPALLCLALLRLQLYPDNLYVECYYLFFLCLIVWLLSREDMPLKKKLTWMNIASFCAFAIRPVLVLVLVPVMGYTFFCVVKKRFPLRRFLILTAVFALILIGNAAVNYRETGYWIWMENYSGSDLFLANNPRTRMESFEVRESRDFGGDWWFEIKESPINQTERNRIYSFVAREWIVQNPGVFLKNTIIKFFILFVSQYWKYTTLLALAGVFVTLRGDKTDKSRKLWELGVNLLLAAATSCGLVIGRYSLPMWPLASLHMAALAHAVLGRCRGRRTGDDIAR